MNQTLNLALYGPLKHLLQRSLIVQARSRVSSHDRANRGNTRPTSVGTPVAGYPTQAETRLLSLR